MVFKPQKVCTPPGEQRGKWDGGETLWAGAPCFCGEQATVLQNGAGVLGGSGEPRLGACVKRSRQALVLILPLAKTQISLQVS